MLSLHGGFSRFGEDAEKTISLNTRMCAVVCVLMASQIGNWENHLCFPILSISLQSSFVMPKTFLILPLFPSLLLAFPVVMPWSSCPDFLFCSNSHWCLWKKTPWSCLLPAHPALLHLPAVLSCHFLIFPQSASNSSLYWGFCCSHEQGDNEGKPLGNGLLCWASSTQPSCAPVHGSSCAPALHLPFPAVGHRGCSAVPRLALACRERCPKAEMGGSRAVAGMHLTASWAPILDDVSKHNSVCLVHTAFSEASSLLFKGCCCCCSFCSHC